MFEEFKKIIQRNVEEYTERAPFIATLEPRILGKSKISLKECCELLNKKV